MSERTTTERPRTAPPPRRMGMGPGIMMRGARAQDFKGSVLRLLRYLGPHRWLVVLVWCLAIGSTAFSIFGPLVMGTATDTLLNGLLGQSVELPAIVGLLTGLLGLYIASALLGYAQSFVMFGITSSMARRMRNDIQAKIHRLPFGFFDGASNGDVMSRVTNDIGTIGQTMNQSLSQFISSITLIGGAVGMMLTISWQMTLAALAVVPVTLGAVFVVVRKSQPFFAGQARHLGQVNGHIEEMLGANVVVRAFGGEARSQAAFAGYNDALYTAGWKASFLSGILMPFTGFVSNLGYVAVCVLGGWLAARGAVTVGNIQSFLQYIRSFNQPLAQLANISNVVQQAAAAAERVFRFLDEPEEETDPDYALSVCRPGEAPDEAAGRVAVRGDVAFAHVDFGYLPDRPVIRDFSAVISAGQRIAIVGHTGAGKTTMVKLLMRFYDVTGGAILVDGYNVRQFRRDDLRGLFGMVLQDTWLFHGTIAENIRYGKLDATDEEVYAAARAAQADHFIRTLPDGYNRMLDEEAGNISQGQRQLLTIARAILADPQILILDEATSSVDTRTEQLIQRAMENLMRGRTSFVIAHRLSTIQNADVILVMQDGAIVEQGSHAELLARGGVYAGLYNSQFEE